MVLPTTSAGSNPVMPSKKRKLKSMGRRIGLPRKKE